MLGIISLSSLMAVLYRFPNYSSLSSHNIWSYRELVDNDRPRKILVSASASSASSSSKNSRVGKSVTVKSNGDLCDELREFVSVVGFPQGHVPSFKELKDHGRMDLANIVRRRGYKLITHLLTNSTHDQSLEGQCQQVSESTQNALLPPLISTIQSPTSSKLDIIQDDDLNIGDGTFSTSCMDEENELGSFVGKISDEISSVDTSVSNSASKMVLPLETHSSDISPGQRFHHVPSQNDLDIQSCAGDDQHEINHLKAMLHQKELELNQLKEQIEKEKLALYTLQAKAENEIGKAQKIQLSKDEELHTVEEGLSGLKEVQIEYCCNGDTVEVAGSFNGWHHKVKMDSHPLSTSVRPAELRNTRVWSTVLWLYPGIYEIKFVVDGQWTIDPQRESVSRGSIHNNILRVDR